MGAVETSATGRRTIRLLEYDPALGASLRPERRAEAEATARATLVEVDRGERTIAELTDGRECPYGALLIDGLANRTVALDGVVSAQLLGRGDLVRAQADAGETLVATTTRWSVIEPLAVALLDEDFLLTVRRWPEIVAALFERVAVQEERRAAHRALCQLPRVEDRVHALMWLLAERWGRMTPQGVLLRLRLTHELLGQLVGAKRPTVSLALKELEERGTVHRRADGGWLLEQAWSAEPTTAFDAAAATDGVALLRDDDTPPLRAVTPLPSPSPLDDVLQRIERMRRVHERVRNQVADTVARSAAANTRSRELREGRDRQLPSTPPPS
jgi:CRP/FNR family transcriptional regulator, cyclic AMP receptor protein